MRYLSLFSGIEAASVAWQPLGWKCVGLAEIEPFCCAVLRQRFPDVPNLGNVNAPDFVKRAKKLGRIDLVVGGSPCQPFSIAGLRKGLHDDRGNLTLRFVEVVDGIGPAWVVWENVPGVLSDRTNGFGCLLAGLAGADAPVDPSREYGWTDAGVAVGPARSASWRVLDAQHFGLAQRRRRVFVVARRAGGMRPAQVLLEPEGVRRNPPSREEAGQGAAADVGSGVGGSGSGEVAGAVSAKWRKGTGGPAGDEAYNLVVPATMAFHTCGYGASEDSEVVPTIQASDARISNQVSGVVVPSLTAYNMDSRSPQSAEQTRTVEAVHAATTAVRRLTPRECERLQGFPDDWTAIRTARKAKKAVAAELAEYVRRSGPWSDDELRQLAADGPRYQALGNSMAVPVVRWIGQRIAANEAVQG